MNEGPRERKDIAWIGVPEENQTVYISISVFFVGRPMVYYRPKEKEIVNDKLVEDFPGTHLRAFFPLISAFIIFLLSCSCLYEMQK